MLRDGASGLCCRGTPVAAHRRGGASGRGRGTFLPIPVGGCLLRRPGGDRAPAGMPPLTDRELAVLRLLSGGVSNSEIAAESSPVAPRVTGRVVARVRLP